MKEYRADRSEGTSVAIYRSRAVNLDSKGNEVNVEEYVGKLKKYDPANHSPDGFNWGYEGSGPSALASSLLKDAVGCHCSYHQFKRETVAKFEDNWKITDERIKEVMKPIHEQYGHLPECEFSDNL